ncbi:exodeoxyribonuclease VII large subunit [compost metagenome]
MPAGRERALEGQQRRLERAALRLELLDPRHALQRGYALLTDAKGQAITRVAQARPGEALRASLSDGDIDLTVSQPRLL